MPPETIESFAPLSAVPDLVHGFVLRDPATDVDTNDRAEMLRRLHPYYERTMASAGIDFARLALTEQIHGDGVATIDAESDTAQAAAGMDGLVTARAGITLGIYVADCCAVYLVDPRRRVCGLVHSGRNGSELGIAAAAIRKMHVDFGTEPDDVTVVLSPCIRPPAYEVDIAALIRRDCLAAGVAEQRIHDAGTDTSADLQRYYSYRAEKGHTGRMLAFIGWREQDDTRT